MSIIGLVNRITRFSRKNFGFGNFISHVRSRTWVLFLCKGYKSQQDDTVRSNSSIRKILTSCSTIIQITSMPNLCKHKSQVGGKDRTDRYIGQSVLSESKLLPLNLPANTFIILDDLA